MREDNKRWLISRLKTSGSKRDHLANGNYADDRHLQKNIDLDDLPSHESIKKTQKFYNGKINYGLLVRFLRGQVGNDWDDIYSEIISRIPTKLLDYKEMIFWFVADKVEFIDGRPWNKKHNNLFGQEKKSNQFIIQKSRANQKELSFLLTHRQIS